MTLKEIRISKGMLQKEVYSDTSMYSRIENGRIIPPPDILIQISDALESTPKAVLESLGLDSKYYFKTCRNKNRNVCKHKVFVIDCDTDERLEKAIKNAGYRYCVDWFMDKVKETISEYEVQNDEDVNGSI